MACPSFWLLENLESSITPLFTSLSSHTPYPLQQQILLSEPGFSHILVPLLLEKNLLFRWLLKLAHIPPTTLLPFNFFRAAYSTQICLMTLVKQKPDFTVAQRLSLNWPLCCHYLRSIFSHHSSPALPMQLHWPLLWSLNRTWDSLLFPSQGTHF